MKNKTYTVVNQKGGVGKTTTALTLGTLFAKLNYKTRVIDADPQRSSVTNWLMPSVTYPYSLADVFFGNCTIDEATIKTDIDNLYIVPSNKSLATVEYSNLPDANIIISDALKESDLDISINIYDSRPSLGVLTIAGLTAATELIVPLNPSALDYQALIELSETVDVIKKRLNTQLKILALVVTRYSNTSLAQQIVNKLHDEYPDVIISIIRKSVKVEEAPFTCKALPIYDPLCTSVIDYENLVQQIINK